MTDESSLPAPRASTDSPVVTFYSYKGGVGRSMALANLAIVAARDYSLNVTVVDWDLEAPGLHRFFGRSDADVSDGVIDYIHNYRKLVTDPPRILTADDLRIDRSLITVRTFKGPQRTTTVRLFAAGDLRNMGDYAQKVQGIDWGRFYSDWNGAQLIESLRQQLKGSADLVLIDSRTGFTDIGGICTMQLPDTVVLVFTFNDQNLAGTERVAHQLTEHNEIFSMLGRRPEIMFLPSRKELSEIARLREWEEKTAERLRQYNQSPRVQRQYPEFLAYIRKVATPYIPYFAFGEELAAETDKGLELVDAYQQLAGLIVGREPLATIRKEPGQPQATARDSFAAALDAVDLPDHVRAALRVAWLDRYTTFEEQTRRWRWLYVALRLTTMLVGVTVPVLLVSARSRVEAWQLALIASFVVAIGVILQLVFRADQRAQEYRRVAEALKAEGLLYLQMAGRYSRFETHERAYQEFALFLDGVAEPRIDDRGTAAGGTYNERQVLDTINLNDTQKTFLRSRWIGQLGGAREAARFAALKNRALTLLVTTLSLACPLLIGLRLVRPEVTEVAETTALAVSVLVVIGLAMQDVLQFDQERRRNQRVAEALEREGWQFLQLSGPYSAPEHSDVFTQFIERVEAILRAQDVSSFTRIRQRTVG